MEDWVLYFDVEKYGFSESFKNELSKQLGEKLQRKLECENLFEDYFYNLFLGMNDIEITERENLVYGTAEIISPDSQSRSITICWESDFYNNLEIHKSDVEGKIEFYFCSDLPIEELKSYIKTKKKKKANEKFGIEINMNNFPDLGVTFEIKDEFTTAERLEIKFIFKRNNKVYVSDFNDNFILLDFQINYNEFNQEIFNFYEKHLNECVSLISDLKSSSKIENIIIE